MDKKTPCYCDKTGEICRWLDIENFSEGGYCVDWPKRMSEEDIKEGCSSYEEC